MTGTWLFGYGSLVSPESMATTIGRVMEPDIDFRVARLDGYGRRWNYGSKVLRGTWTHEGVTVRDGLVVSLGIIASPDEFCTGVVFNVTDEELAALDWRERDYDRVVVTDLITVEREPVDAPVSVYVPRSSSIARYEEHRDAGRAAIRKSYWKLCREAFSALGGEHRAWYDATPAPDIPVVDIALTP